MQKFSKIFQQHNRNAWCLKIVKAIVACISLATLSMIPLWLPLLSGPAFHHALPSRMDYISALLLLLLLTFLFLLIFLVIRFLSPVRRRIIGGCVLFAFLLCTFDRLRVNVGHIISDQLNANLIFKISPLILVGLLVFVFKKMYLKYWSIVFWMSPFSAIVIFQLVLRITFAPPPEQLGFNRLVPTSLKLFTNRVVWIVFDELDYRLAFTERPRSSILQNFDRLANKSVNFSNALPPAQMTAISIPSLIDGKAYIASYPTSKDNLVLRLEDNTLSTWGSRKNVFSDNLEINGNSAVVGWFLPYTRVFSGRLDYSQWEPNSPDRYIGLESELVPTMCNHLKAFNAFSKRELHRQTLESCVKHAAQVVANEKYSLCFVHLPIPHLPSTQPWQYNLPQGTAVNYFRNLSLADQVLGKIMQQLEKSPAVCNTTVIVSSDHHWRNSRLYDSKSDPRVPLIIRFPNQTERIELTNNFKTVNTRYLIQDIMRAFNLVDAAYGEKLIKRYFANQE